MQVHALKRQSACTQPVHQYLQAALPGNKYRYLYPEIQQTLTQQRSMLLHTPKTHAVHQQGNAPYRTGNTPLRRSRHTAGHYMADLSI